MKVSLVLNTREEIDAAIKDAGKDGLRWASSSNAGAPMGWVRVTFLPSSAFAANKDTPHQQVSASVGEMIARVRSQLDRYIVEEHVNGSFFILDQHTANVVRQDLTAEDEPYDICADLNARAIVSAMREPTPEMEAAFNGACDEHGHVLWRYGYKCMIDAILNEKGKP